MGLRGDRHSVSRLKPLEEKLYPLGLPSRTFVLFTILHFSLEGPLNPLPTVTSYPFEMKPQNTWNDCPSF